MTRLRSTCDASAGIQNRSNDIFDTTLKNFWAYIHGMGSHSVAGWKPAVRIAAILAA